MHCVKQNAQASSEKDTVSKKTSQALMERSAIPLGTVPKTPALQRAALSDSAKMNDADFKAEVANGFGDTEKALGDVYMEMA
eukprot:scaffold382328_cov182-Cyclotella_meneghiniana.AAC.1